MVGYWPIRPFPVGRDLKCTSSPGTKPGETEPARWNHRVVERTFDLICYLIFIGITVLMHRFRILVGQYVEQKLETIASSPVCLWARALIVAAAIVMIWLLIKYFFSGNIPITGSSSRINAFIKGLGEGFSHYPPLRHSQTFILHTLFIWSMYLLQIYIGFYAMDGTDHLSVKRPSPC